MKKLSLLLASITLATVSAFAQTKPAAPTYVTVTDFANAAGDKSYYLYNVDAGVFLTGGNDWGTRASVATDGNTGIVSVEDLKLGKATISGLAWTIGEADNTEVGGATVNCYSFKQDSHKVGDADKKGYLTADDWTDGDGTGIWVDGTDGTGDTAVRPYNKWFVSDIKNNTFKLSYLVSTTEDDVTTWSKPAGFLGVQKFADGDTRTYIMEGSNTTWALVEEAAYTTAATALNLYYVQVGLSELIEKGNAQTANKYDSYKSKINSTNRDEIIAAINEINPLILLGEALSAAKAEDSSRDWSAFEKVYSEAKADADSLNKVTDKVNALIALHKSIATLAAADAKHDNSEILKVYNNDNATVAEINDAKTLTEAFITLQKYLAEYSEKYPSVDFTEPTKVYNTATATVKELEAALEKAKELVTNYEQSKADLEHPADITESIGYLVDLAAIANVNGNAPTGWASTKKEGSFHINTWSGEGDADGTNMTTPFIEYWKAAGSLLDDQEFYRDQVKYPFTVQPGAYRISANIRLYNESGATYMTGASLFGNANATNLVKPGVEDNSNVISGAVYGNYNGMLYYWKDSFETYAIVPADGTFKFGVRTEGANFNWVASKGWKVEYLGASYESLDYVRKNAALAVPTIDDETVVTKSVLDEFNAAKDAYDKATTADAILAAYPTLMEAAEVLPANIAAWKAYMAKKAEVEEKAEPIFASKEGEYVWRLQDYLNENKTPDDEFPNGTYNYIIAQRTLSVEQLEKETEFLTQLLDDAIKKGLAPGDDCTDMIVNAAFSNGFTGWTNSAGNVGDFSALTPKIPNNVEVYGNVVNCYQVVKDVPDGIYSLSVKAFERPAGNGSYDGTESSKVSLFMNDFQTPVQNIVADAMPEELAKDGVNCYITRSYTSGAGSELLDYLVDGHGYVPNGMVGAAVAFGAGRYEQTVYGLVEGGEMKIGVTSNGVGIHWVLWADFKLTYEGKSVEALKSIIETTGARALAYLDENSDYMTAPAYEAIMNAYALAIAASDDEDADAMWDALMALNKALNDGPANVAALEEFFNAYDEFDDAYTSYYDDASESTQAASDKVYAECGYESEAYLDLTTEELQALTEELKRATALLLLPSGYEDADDNNPFEMTSAILNPDFEDGVNNWTLEKTGIQNAGIKTSGLYGQSAEFWNASVGSDYWFNISQKLRALPAGTYELIAVAFNAQVDNADAEGYAALYAITTGGNVSSTKLQFTTETPVENNTGGEGSLAKTATTISLFFKVEEGEGVTIGFQSIGEMPAHWFICDNFELWYYGTDSKNAPTEDEGLVDIDGVEVESPAIEAIYTVTGAKVSSLQKGINIVKYANGKVAKVLVK